MIQSFFFVFFAGDDLQRIPKWLARMDVVFFPEIGISELPVNVNVHLRSMAIWSVMKFEETF